LAGGLLLAVFGCARGAPIVGHRVVQEGTYYGDLGITGNGSNVTVLRHSRITKLSIIGNNCTVMVEEGAGLGKIEFWGNGNVVSIPDVLIVRSNNVGANQIIRRPRPPAPVVEDPYAAPPPPLAPMPSARPAEPPPTTRPIAPVSDMQTEGEPFD
jgi:hypothetical protein